MSEAFKLAPHEWALLRSLLDEALALPPARRADWLEALDDERSAGLKPKLRALLANAADAGDSAATAARLLDTLPKVETGQFAPLPGAVAEQPGDTVGPYRLIRELGSGGMGSVWLAERTDMLHGRQVALKLPHGAWKRAGLAERMAREREILATLEHPNIARLYDAGLAADGQPWLALEYVRGRRIDVVCRTASLPLRVRLHLFLQAAHAVAHAHAHLVVHRDLKPANILVTAEGSVKLLDFGIAKLVQESVPEGEAGVMPETELTREGGRVLTPEYASPEQILGQPIGTASDVYSLGVVLFELLTDARPYQLTRRSRSALEEAIVAANVPRPSTVAPPERRAALRGDLDTIVLKALRRDPAARYATVAALADDLQRHLDHRPVLAQPESMTYQLSRFVRRNRVAVAAAAAVSAALVGGTAVAAWQAAAARVEQRRAEEARAFIESIFVNADPFGEAGRRLTGVEMLRQARVRLAGMVTASPQVRADMLNTLAASLINLEDADGAASVLDDAARETPALGAQHRETFRSTMLRARLELLRARAAEARRLIEPVATTLRALDRPDELRAALLVRSEAENAALDWVAAEASARELLQLAERRGDAARVDRIAALLQLSVSHDRRNQAQQALETARQAHELAAATFRHAAAHPMATQARATYAAALWDMDEQDRAVDLMRESQRDIESVFGADSRIAAQQARKMAIYLSSTGYIKEALAAVEHAVRVLGPGLPTDSLAYAQLLESRTNALLNLNRPAEALADAMRAHEIYVARLGADHEQVHITQAYQARAAMLQGRVDEATRLLESMLERYRKTGYSTVAAPTFLLGLTRRLAGDPARALELQQTAFSAVRKGPTARRWGSRVLIEIGLNRLALGDVAGARAPLAEALAIVQEKFRAPTPLLANARLGLGRVELATGRPEEALALLEQADAYWRDADPRTRAAGEAAFWLGRAQRALGREPEAVRSMERAAQILAQSPFAIDRPLYDEARKLSKSPRSSSAGPVRLPRQG